MESERVPPAERPPPERPRVLVCGGRDYDDTERIFEVLDRINPLTICHGGQATWVPERRGYIGADYLAGLWARERGIYCQVFEADWRAFGPRAGPMRNKVMLDAFEPDLVIAFPGGRGTESMMTLARRRRVPIMQIAR
jgi:hypothetical protein